MSGETLARVDDSSNEISGTVCQNKGVCFLSNDEVQSGELGVEPSGRGSNETSSGDNNTVLSSDEFHAPSSHYSSSRGGSGSFRSPRQSKFQRKKSSLNQKLAELTVNKLQFEKLDRLYGRDNECLRLQNAWEEILQARRRSRAGDPLSSEQERNGRDASTGSRRVITIRGTAGTGKTSLAGSLRRTVNNNGGIFLQGKFPQQLQLAQSASEPFAAFASAFGELCEVVASLSSTLEPQSGPSVEERPPHGFGKFLNFTVSDFRERLTSEVGSEVHILSRMIPAMSQVLGRREASDSSGSSADSVGFQDAPHRIKSAFRRFLRVISYFAPVVLVLDDLQWPDVASLELLESLVLDRQNSFLVLACYRDDESFDNGKPHVAAMEQIRIKSTLGGGLKYDAISIGNLDFLQLHDLLMDLLSSDRDESAGLAECVQKKTLGNIFFTIQYLTMLQESELLVYNFGALKWTWDLEAILLKTAATENVVSLMTRKMKSLPESVGKYLPMMACLGSSFVLPVFEIVMNHPRSVEYGRSESDDPEHGSKASQILARCENEGLIQSCGDDAHEAFRWVHDKIQEAAQSLISESALQSLRLQLGEILYECLEPNALETYLFVIANLLRTDCDDESALPRQQPLQVANFFLRAGTKAIENSAFDQALVYLMKGIELLPSDTWHSHYALSLRLYSTAAEAAYCTGNFESMRSYCQAVLHQEDRPIIDKRRVYSVLIDALAAERTFDEALALCQSILSKLGCRFPKRLVGLHVIGGLVRFKFTMKVSSLRERMAQLPRMSNEEMLWAMALLDKFVTCSYFSKSKLVPLAILKGVRMTMDGGVSPFSPVMFALLGFSLAAFAQDYKGALVFAERAIDLLKNVKSSRKVESRVVFMTHALVFHFLRPASLSIKPLLRSYDVGMTMGDTESAAWSICFCLEFSFLTGTSLDALKSDFAFYTEQLREVKQLKILRALLNMWQSILFLTGDNSFDGSLSGDIVQQGQAIQETGEEANADHASILKTIMYVATILGLHKFVYQCICESGMEKGSYDAIFPGVFSLCHLYAFSALSMLSLFRESKTNKYLKLAKQFAGKIKVLNVAGVRLGVAALTMHQLVCYSHLLSPFLSRIRMLRTINICLKLK